MENIRKLDCSGLVCPMPVAKTKRTLIEMNSGDILEINGNFLEAGENIKRFAENQGHQILEFKIDGDKYYLKIKKK